MATKTKTPNRAPRKRSPRKLKLSDMDVIDVALRDLEDQRLEAKSKIRISLDKVRKVYETKLNAFFLASNEGKRLKRMYPNVRADGYGDYPTPSVTFELYDDEGSRRRYRARREGERELQGTIPVSARTGRPFARLKSRIHSLEADMRAIDDDGPLKWRRRKLKEALQASDLTKLRRLVEKAARTYGDRE